MVRVDRIVARTLDRIDPFTVEVRFDCPARLSRYVFEDRFRARYTVPVDSVPDSLLIIPFLANILPFAWLFDALVQVETVDEKFADSAEKVRAGFAYLYPALSLGGGLHAQHLEYAEPPPHTRVAMLFTGGLDSTVTFARHAAEHPLLITVNSTAGDLEPPDTWPALLADVEGFARLTGSSNLVVTSNLRRMFNTRALDTAFRGHFNNWWGGIQHGYGLAGLTAPLSSAVGFSRLYVASTLSRSMPYPWGSDPLIDNAIAWSGSCVEHDAYDLNRHDKIAVLSEFRERLGSDLALRVCDYVHGAERNCGRCEKCCRTMTELIVQGHEPISFGLPPLSARHVERRLTNGSWDLPRGILSYWTDLQGAARTALLGEVHGTAVATHAQYLRWLEAADFLEFRRRSDRNLHRRVRFVLGFLPRPVIRLLERVRRALGRT